MQLNMYAMQIGRSQIEETDCIDAECRCCCDDALAPGAPVHMWRSPCIARHISECQVTLLHRDERSRALTANNSFRNGRRSGDAAAAGNESLEVAEPEGRFPTQQRGGRRMEAPSLRRDTNSWSPRTQQGSAVDARGGGHPVGQGACRHPPDSCRQPPVQSAAADRSSSADEARCCCCRACSARHCPLPARRACVRMR